MQVSRRSVLSAAGAALALGLAGCTREQVPPGPTTPTSPVPGGSPHAPLTVATAATPVALVPGWRDDAESLRVIRQVAEPLLGVDPNTGAPVASLATDWSVSEDGLTYDFTLREGVLFHDGTELNAQAVVQAMTRWSALPQWWGQERLALAGPLPFVTVFGGFAGQEQCLLESVQATSDLSVRLSLTDRIVFLLDALTSPAFAITAPSSWPAVDRALQNSPEDELPAIRVVGTGPYRWPDEDHEDLEDSRAEGAGLELVAWERHWDGVATASPVHLVVIPRAEDRLRELHRGRVDVVDVVTPPLLRPLVQQGAPVLQRDPLAVVYLGMNLAEPTTHGLYFRRAVAHAVDRRALVEAQFLAGTSVAHQFIPPSLGVNTEDLTTYDHDPERARELLALSGYEQQPLEFHFPLHTGRAHLPSPEEIFAQISGDLAAVGIRVVPRPVPWDTDYVARMRASSSSRAFHLGGSTASFRDPHCFVDPLFGQGGSEFGYTNPRVAQWISQARSTQDEQARRNLYGRAAVSVSLDLPALPLAFPISAVALGPRVLSYPVSPVLDERFDDVEVRDGA